MATDVHRGGDVLLPGDGGHRRAARLLVQGGHAGLRAGHGPDELAFPDYDGNGMFKSLGNILVNPAVGLLFIAMGERPARLRVQGEARVSGDDPLIRTFVGAQLLVRVTARAIFPNCPRYIPRDGAPSVYAPDGPGIEPPEPAWKGLRIARRDTAAGSDAEGRARIGAGGQRALLEVADPNPMTSLAAAQPEAADSS